MFKILGGALIALGSWIMVGGEEALSTRSPPCAFHFTRLSLWLLAAAPAPIGAVFWHMCEAADRRNQPLFRLPVGIGMALLGLAFGPSKTY